MMRNYPTRLAFLLTFYQIFLIGTHAFTGIYRSVRTTGRSLALNCICINCAKVVDCQAYHFVERKHEQPHMNDSPAFRPREGSPSINVHIRTLRNEAEQKRMQDEMDNQESLFLCRGSNLDKMQVEETECTPTAYEISEVFTEYDVIACEDFEEDDGAWIRNMPEEIRLANPTFVPT